MKNKYLIRLDDACPTMDAVKWQKMEKILDIAGICPMVGIIPNNHDPKQSINAEDKYFWEKVNRWNAKGWIIALHGYDHCYISQEGLKGLNPLWSRSEFAGVSLDMQKHKIRDGVKVLRKYDINPRFFFAPSHTFDKNTLIALKQESDIRIVSDTIALNAYQNEDFTFIPCQLGHFRNVPLSGLWTFCFHPNMMLDAEIELFNTFIEKERRCFVSWNDIDYDNCGNKSIASKILSFMYFSYRKLEGLK